jgi:cell division protein FtsZ
MAVGKASGEDRARMAAEQAISSQLLDITIDGARGVLFNITGGPGMTLFEVNQAAAIIRETAHPDVNMIFGAVIDPNMGDDMRITVIATGFERAVSRRITTPSIIQRPVEHNTGIPVGRMPEHANVASSPAQQSQPSNAEFRPQTFNSDDLDIPTFLRNRK